MTDSRNHLGTIRKGWVIATLTNLHMYAAPEESAPKAFEVEMICVSVTPSHEEHRWVLANRHLLPSGYFGHTSTENLHPFDSEVEAWIAFIQTLTALQVEERARTHERAAEVSALRTYAWRKANTMHPLLPLQEVVADHANT